MPGTHHGKDYSYASVAFLRPKAKVWSQGRILAGKTPASSLMHQFSSCKLIEFSVHAACASMQNPALVASLGDNNRHSCRSNVAFSTRACSSHY